MKAFFKLIIPLIVYLSLITAITNESNAQVNLSIIQKNDTMKRFIKDLETLESILNCSNCLTCKPGCEIECPLSCPPETLNVPNKSDGSLILPTDMANQKKLNVMVNLDLYYTKQAVFLKKRIKDSRVTFGEKYDKKLELLLNRTEYVIDQLDIYFKRATIISIFAKKD